MYALEPHRYENREIFTGSGNHGGMEFDCKLKVFKDEEAVEKGPLVTLCAGKHYCC